MSRSPALLSQRNIAMLTFFSDKTITGKGFKLEVFAKKYDSHYHSHYFPHGYYPYHPPHQYVPHPHVPHPAPCHTAEECDDLPLHGVAPVYDYPYHWGHWSHPRSVQQYAQTSRFQQPGFPGAATYQPQPGYPSPLSYGAYNYAQDNRRYSSPTSPSQTWNRGPAEEAPQEESTNKSWSQPLSQPSIPVAEK